MRILRVKNDDLQMDMISNEKARACYKNDLKMRNLITRTRLVLLLKIFKAKKRQLTFG